MSTRKNVKSRPVAKLHPPYIGAWLRMAYQTTRRRVLAALVEQGFTDLNQAHLSVFVYPPPEGARPTDVAERANMTKQAMNYLLGQLNGLGYIERRAAKGAGRRLVYLTQRGRRVFETQWTAMQELEAEWSRILGKKRFDELLRTLRQLALADAKGAQVLSHWPDRSKQAAE